MVGSARLIIDWGTIAQGAVQPPVIVIAKIAAEREPQPAVRREPSAVHELGLQRMEERLHVRVVARRADARRALPNPQRSQPVAERLGGILAAAIAVEDEPRTRTPAPGRRIEDGARRGPPERPREHAAGVLVQYDREKAPPTHDRQVGDLSRSTRRRLTAHPSACNARWMRGLP